MVALIWLRLQIRKTSLDPMGPECDLWITSAFQHFRCFLVTAVTSAVASGSVPPESLR